MDRELPNWFSSPDLFEAADWFLGEVAAPETKDPIQEEEMP